MLAEEKIKADLRKKLSKRRYEHCIRVALVSRDLARKYGSDERKAYLAGLVHDVCKEFTEEENKKFIESHHLSRDLLDDSMKNVRHAFIGAIIADEEYKLDEDICNAIRYHNIGNIPMSLLDKIVFVADKIEPGKDFEGISEERRLAYENLDEAFVLILENYFKELKRRGLNMHPTTVRVLSFYKSHLK